MNKIYIFSLEKKYNKKQFVDSICTVSLNSAIKYINKHYANIIILDIEIRTYDDYKLVNV